ncbi:MAG: PepSY domain-containing protein [Gammaproteobacteria bacterium]
MKIVYITGLTATILGGGIIYPSAAGDIFLGEQSFSLARLDAEEARELKQSGQIMSLESLIARVREDYPGTIIEIELDDKNDRYIYEIEVVNDEGVVIDLEIDAATGEVLKYEKDY